MIAWRRRRRRDARRTRVESGWMDAARICTDTVCVNSMTDENTCARPRHDAGLANANSIDIVELESKKPAATVNGKACKGIFQAQAAAVKALAEETRPDLTVRIQPSGCFRVFLRLVSLTAGRIGSVDADIARLGALCRQSASDVFTDDVSERLGDRLDKLDASEAANARRETLFGALFGQISNNVLTVSR
jgi:hypothetical protein